MWESSVIEAERTFVQILFKTCVELWIWMLGDEEGWHQTNAGSRNENDQDGGYKGRTEKKIDKITNSIDNSAHF